MADAQPDAWLRGQMAGYEPLVMPVVHALIQAREEITSLVGTVSEDSVWVSPGGAASVGFHVRHLGGALDRLFTYARGQGLSEEQLAALAEGDELAVRGIEELRQVVAGAAAGGIPDGRLSIDVSIARGLDYYTRTTFEFDHPLLGAQSGIGGGGTKGGGASGSLSSVKFSQVTMPSPPGRKRRAAPDLPRNSLSVTASTTSTPTIRP